MAKVKMNRFAAKCCFCRVFIPAGKGHLFYVAEEDDLQGYGPLGMAGWLVRCIDESACRGRVAENKRERETKKERILGGA